MSQRIAVASSDGKFINQHFGRATQFLIFDLESNTPKNDYQFVELRPNKPSCNWGEPEEAAHLQTIQNISDCQTVLVSQIGPGALAVLADHGICAVTIFGFIDEVLLNFNF